MNFAFWMFAWAFEVIIYTNVLIGSPSVRKKSALLLPRQPQEAGVRECEGKINNSNKATPCGRRLRDNTHLKIFENFEDRPLRTPYRLSERETFKARLVYMIEDIDSVDFVYDLREQDEDVPSARGARILLRWLAQPEIAVTVKECSSLNMAPNIEYDLGSAF